MLASSGEPFDGEDWFFEVKWDGMRALAFVETDSVRIVNRQRRDATLRYPELAPFCELPPGSVIDGEIVVLRSGKPDFERLVSREQARSARRARIAAQTNPATFIAFDLLYEKFVPIQSRALRERRERLRTLLESAKVDPVVLSDGVEAEGRAFFDGVCERGLEGVVAKRLESRYTPGVRSPHWIKIKRRHQLCCAVIGYLAEGDDVRSLVIAADTDGGLAYVGRVGSGIDEATRARLLEELARRPAEQPIVECPIAARWVAPGVYCTVDYLEISKSGKLRGPVFRSLVIDGD